MGHIEIGLCGHIDAQQGTTASYSIEIVGQGKGQLWRCLALELLQQGHHRYATDTADAKHTDCEIGRGLHIIKHRSKIT